LGALAAAMLFYKVATPARYASTVFITMKAIRQLMPRGLIRPKKVPEIVQKFFKMVGINLK
jgi:hypothetical protein